VRAIFILLFVGDNLNAILRNCVTCGHTRDDREKNSMFESIGRIYLDIEDYLKFPRKIPASPKNS
jgi:hypothetical protein